MGRPRALAAGTAAAALAALLAAAPRPARAQTPTPLPSPGACPGLAPEAPATSCLDAYRSCGSTDTIVWIKPGADPAYAAYCAADGWALALRVDGTAPTFNYSSPLWTSTALYNPDVNDVWFVSDAKLAPFVSHPVRQVRLVFKEPGDAGATGPPLVLTLPAPAASLQALFAAGAAVRTDADVAAWTAAAVSPPAPQHTACAPQGVLSTAPAYYSWEWTVSARIGLLGDDYTDCRTANSGIGVGLVVTTVSGSGLPVVPVAGAFSGYTSAPRTVFVYVREGIAPPSPSPTSTVRPDTTPSPAGSPSAAAGGPWLPDALPGLAVWLRPEELPAPGATLSSWPPAARGLPPASPATGAAPVVGTAAGLAGGTTRVLPLTAPASGGVSCVACVGQSVTVPFLRQPIDGLATSSSPKLTAFLVARVADGTPLRRVLGAPGSPWALFTAGGRYDTLLDGAGNVVEYGTNPPLLAPGEPLTTATTPPSGWTLWTAVVGLGPGEIGLNASAFDAADARSGALNGVYRNGTLRRTSGVPAVAGPPALLSLGGAAVGGNGEYTSVTLAEVLVVAGRGVTASERERVEGYLACKYGLQASLPPGHSAAAACPTIAATALPTPTPLPTPSPVLAPCPSGWTRPAGSGSCYRSAYLGSLGADAPLAHALCGVTAVSAGGAAGGLASMRSYDEAAFVVGARCGGMPPFSPGFLWAGPADTDDNSVSDTLSAMWTGLTHAGSLAGVSSLRNDSSWRFANGADVGYITAGPGAWGGSAEWWHPGRPASNAAACAGVTRGSRNLPRPRLADQDCAAALRYACCEITALTPGGGAASPSATPAPAFGRTGELLPSVPVEGTLPAASYRVYRIVPPADGDVTFTLAARLADGWNVSMCEYQPYYWSNTMEWLCRTPAVYVFTRAVNAPEAGAALTLPASPGGTKSGSLYRQSARVPLYVLVANERADVAVGYSLTAAVAVTGDAGHALPGLPSATPLPSPSTYPLAPLNASAPDPWYALVNRTGAALPLLMGYTIDGGTNHTVAFTAPSAGAGVTWRATLVPSPGSRLSLSAARTAPSGFQGSVWAPIDVAPSSYWSPQVVSMWSQRPDWVPGTTYYLRVGNAAPPGGPAASYNLLIEPLAPVAPPGATQYLTSGVPTLVYVSQPYHVSALVLHVTRPGSVTVTMTPLGLQGVWSEYFSPQYDAYNTGADFSNYIGSGYACCARSSAPTGTHTVQAGDVTVLTRVSSFYAEWGVYSLLVTFTPTGAEAGPPSATPLPSAAPTALPAPVPFWNQTALPPLPFNITYDLATNGYHNWVLTGARGLVYFRLSAHTLWSWIDVYICTAPPTGATLQSIDSYSNCAGSSYRATSGDTLIAVQAGVSGSGAGTPLYVRVQGGYQAPVRYSLSAWGSGELTPAPPSGAVLPLNEGAPITASVQVGGYLVFRYRSPRDGPVTFTLRRLWTQSCQSLYLRSFGAPIMSPEDVLRQSYLTYDSSYGCGASPSAFNVRTIPQYSAANGGAGAEYFLLVEGESSNYYAVGTGPNDGLMGTFTLDARTDPSGVAASPTAVTSPPPTASPLPSITPAGPAVAAASPWPQPAPYYAVTDAGSAPVALHRMVDVGKWHK
jgi:hypothetical protein